MAKATLPTNYKDDILNSSMGGKRRYKQTTNADGTVSLEDASTYDQVGSNFGASQLNAISKAVNESADSSKIISDPDTASATTEQGYIADVQLFNHLNDSLGGIKFGVDKNGNYGYIKAGADSVTPFKRGLDLPYDLLQNQIGGISPIMTIEVDVSKIVCGTNPIDFTNISKIDASFGHANGTFYFALTDEPLSTASEIQNNAIFVQTTSSNSVFKTIDTSNITGEKYLSIYLYTSTNLNGYITSLIVS